LTILTFISVISPLPGWTAALPFALVLLAGMIKEGIEDYKRHAADRIINNRPYTIIGPDGLPLITRSEDLVVGDFVVLQQNQEVPADCVVMATSDSDGLCYVETAQLDGETNLKRRFPYRATEKLQHEGFAKLRGTIYCSTPSFHLDEFSGAFDLNGEGKRQPVDESNLVIRGTMLRNTSWIVCLVCYTGFRTKLALNSSTPPSKYSALNKMVDKMVLVIIAVQIAFCIAAAVLASQWQTSQGIFAHYLLIGDSPATVGVVAFFTYLILLSYVVPQTLMISLEVAKLVQGRWMEWDADMALDPTRIRETGCKARSTDQNDELGRVKWIMSDKTGTLTANEMKMVEAVVGGVAYKDVMQGTLLQALRKADVAHSRLLSEYLFALAVCHTVAIGEVITDEQIRQKKNSPWKHLFTKMSNVFKKKSQTVVTIPGDGGNDNNSYNNGKKKGGPVEMDEFRVGKWKELIYKGSSPDEEAFCKFTLRNGFVFSARVRDEVEVTVEIDPDHPDPHHFFVLHNLEYTSARAKMSVIVRDSNGQVVVYTKGADSAVLPLVDASLTPKDMLDRTTEMIDRLAATGLRTLVVARRTLEPAFYASWAEKLRRATTGDDGTALDDRKQAQLDLYTEVESDLELVGVTAVEDRLQDNVPECIAFFLNAGIRFVMITGDKLETAENIAFSTRLFNRAMTVVYMADAKSIAHAEELMVEAEKRANEAPLLAVVVDGATLKVGSVTPFFFLLSDCFFFFFQKYLLKEQAGLSDRFYDLLHRAAAVVCCRANPRIKAKGFSSSFFSSSFV
jgi:magnesium-transporting ATPase (P-type)